jgi:hypothetical protein
VICRILNSQHLPAPVREKVIEYAREKAAGFYGGNQTQQYKFVSKLYSERADRLHMGMGFGLQTPSRQDVT